MDGRTGQQQYDRPDRDFREELRYRQPAHRYARASSVYVWFVFRNVIAGNEFYNAAELDIWGFAERAERWNTPRSFNPSPTT